MSAPPVLRLPRSLADFERMGFRLDRPVARAVLEGHARSFLDGFDLAARHWHDPHPSLATVPAHRRGFAYEGAGMHAALRDLITCGRGGALTRLLDGPGDRFAHLVHVGYGWGLAPLRLRGPVLLPATPLLRWLALDGAGFADTYFGGLRALRRLVRSRRTHARWAARVAGAGRALWFVASAHGPAVAGAIAAAPVAARPHLWSGVGLACAYAGCAGPDELARLLTATGSARAHFLQGVAFGVAARVRAGVVPDDCGSTARVLLGVEPAVAAGWTDTAAEGLAGRPDVDAYETWKARLRDITAQGAAVRARAVTP